MILTTVSSAAAQRAATEIGPRLLQDPVVAAAVQAAEALEPWVIEQQVALCEVEAPPFKEQARAEVYRQAFERLRDRFIADGRDLQLRLFEEHDLAPPQGRPSQVELASRHGIGAKDVEYHLGAMRKAVRAEVRRELERLTLDDRDVQEEWNALFGAR